MSSAFCPELKRIDEFTPRFNRRTSRSSGQVFRRLIIDQAVARRPITEADVAHGYPWTGDPELDLRRAPRLWPCRVSSSLRVPLDVLSLDDPGVGAQPACGIEPSHEEGNGVSPAVFSALNRKLRRSRACSVKGDRRP